MARTNDLADLIEQSDDLDWLHSASCASLGIEQLDLFFLDAGRSLSKETAAMCERCPARAACLTHAYDNEIAGGYYGGFSPTKRRTLSLDEALDTFTATA